MPNAKEIETFALLLRHFGLYKPEELYKVVCPFHDDKNASMQISIPKAFYYCYGCGASGSSLELFKGFWKLKHNKTLTDLEARLKIQALLSRTYDSSYTTSSNTKEHSFSLLNQYNLQQKESYKEGITEARQYFYNLPSPNWYRCSSVPCVEQETIECKRYMKHRGFTPRTLTKAQAKPSLNKYYPIVFPLLENGIFRGYVMRTFDPEVEAQRKYMYNRGFKRERTLAGNFGIKHTGIQTVLIVEGYLDCLKVQQLGIHSVVAILGWKVSGTQLDKLKRAGVKHIICGTDNDEAGRKGYKYLKLVQKQQKWYKLSRVRFPESIKDFGELQKGTVEAERMLNQLKNLGIT